MTSSVSRSSTFPQKSSTIQLDERSTVCSSNSSCFFRKRKPMNPYIAYPLRFNYRKTNTNPVKQRVMSAKLLKLRQLENQLNDANYHLAEISRENQILKTMQKRQDKALSKYEDTNAELPRLIHSHEEECRILTERIKIQKKTITDLTAQLKMKENELNRSRELLLHLKKLNRDKNLIEREKLTEEMEHLKLKLQKNDEQINVLNRQLFLENKLSKQRINSETIRNKQLQKELLRAMDEIVRLNELLDKKDNVIRPRKLLNRDTVPIVTSKHEKLNATQPPVPVTEVKLKPLTTTTTIVAVADEDDAANSSNKSMEEMLKNPIENIKQRLSSSSSGSLHNLVKRYPSSENISLKSISSASNKSLKLEKISTLKSINLHTKEDEKLLLDKSDMEQLFDANRKDYQSESSRKSSTNIEETLIQLTDNLDAAIQRTSQNPSMVDDELDDKNLNTYYMDVLNNVKSCSKMMDIHQEGFLSSARQNSNNLMRMFDETEKIESKLKQSFFNTLNDDMKSSQLENQKSIRTKIEAKADHHKEDEKPPLVNFENKKRLLAALRAIDNGDSIEELEKNQESKKMKEIFGHVTH